MGVELAPIELFLDPLPVFIGAGECVVREGWIHAKECQPHMKLLVCEKGTFTLNMDQQPFILYPDQYVIIPGGVVWETTKPSVEGDRFWWIIFGEGGSRTLHSQITLEQLTTLDDPHAAKQVFERLLWRIRKCPDAQLGLQLGVAEVIWELNRQQHVMKTELPQRNRAHILAQEIIVSLRTNLNKPLNVKQLAENCGIHVEYMRKVFKEATNRTVQQYLRFLRIEQARIHMEHGDLLISEIAALVGYEDASHFSKVFHKETGMWPTEFRFQQMITQNVDGQFYPFVRRPGERVE